MNMGRVIVNPDLPIGGTIAKNTWNMPAANDYDLTCSGDGYITYSAKVTSPGAREIMSKVYSTNVKGIGLRFTRERDSMTPIIYEDIVTQYNRDITDYNLVGSKFTLEVIKTEETTESGVLAAGNYTEFYWNGDRGNPILETYLTANAITVVSPSCVVSSGKNQTVVLDPIKVTDLHGRNTFAGEQAFAITLQCSGGVQPSGTADINIQFDGNIATGTTKRDGVLINEREGSSAAKGVGIQVLDDADKELIFEHDYSVGRLTNDQMKTFVLDYKARYYQYGSSIDSGEVESHMVFNLSYD